MKLKELVKKGAALLDERGPKNWWNKIKLKKLDMHSSEVCILGQLYGNGNNCGYLNGVAELKVCGYDYGYSLHIDYTRTEENWKRLAKKWKKLIKKKRKAVNPPVTQV